MVKELKFNVVCGRIAAVICLSAVFRVLFTCVFVMWGSAAAVFICDLSACAMLGLYFKLVSLALNKKTDFGLTDKLALIFKILFLFLPGLSIGDLIYIHIAAIAADTGFCAFYDIYKHKIFS